MKLNQKKSPQRARIKYLLVLLMLPLMLCITATAFDKPYGIIDLMPRNRPLLQDTLKKPVPAGKQGTAKKTSKTEEIPVVTEVYVGTQKTKNATVPPPPPRVLKRAAIAPPPPPAPPKVLEKTIAPPPPPKPPSGSKKGRLATPPRPIVAPVPAKLPTPPKPMVDPVPSEKAIAPKPTVDPVVDKAARSAAKENLPQMKGQLQATTTFRKRGNYSYAGMVPAPGLEKRGNNGFKVQWYVTKKTSEHNLRFAPTSEKRGNQELRDILIDEPAPKEKSKNLPVPVPQSPNGMKKEKSTPAGTTATEVIKAKAAFQSSSVWGDGLFRKLKLIKPSPDEMC